MFKLNLKIALRNLFKNKVYAAINIGGLTLGLTAFVLLLLFVNHEVSYDRWTPDLDKVYQLREHHDFFTPDNKQRWMESTESRIAALVSQQVPQFSNVTKIGRDWGGNGYSVKLEDADPILIKSIRDVDSLFFKVFPYKFIEGNAENAINKPNTVVLKMSIAIQLFGTEKVLGKQIRLAMWRNDPGNRYTVTGVVEDPSTPQSVFFNILSHSGEREKDPENLGSSNYCEIYASAPNKLDTQQVNKILHRVYVDYKKAILPKQQTSFKEYYSNGKRPGLKIVPLQEVYSNPSESENWFDKIKPIIALSIFLLVVSIINFVNLATAQSVQRAKEVGVKKVLGAYKKQLVVQFLFEAAIQTLSALFLCVILVEVLLPAFGNHFEVDLSFWRSEKLPALLAQLLGLFFVITLLAGFYPALVLSKYNPVKVLKGNYESGAKGIILRNGLVVIQFVIAVTFIIGIGVMQLQTSYVANKDLGFERDRLINILTNYEEDAFVSQIRKVAGVKYVATTTQVMGNSFNVPYDINFETRKYTFNSVTVTMDALPALGVQLVKGRIFSPEYRQDTANSVVLNQSAAKLLGNNVIGKTFTMGKGTFPFRVVGIIKDYTNEGFEKVVLPTLYKVTSNGGSSNTNNLLIKFESGNYQSAMKSVERIWRKQFPNYPMIYTSIEDAFQNAMRSTRKQMQIIVLFSLISVGLSLLGIFALSTFMAKRRTKEIAIRKILGATDLQLINMLNRSFLILVITANLLSWPIAFVFTKKWLEGFAYRIDMPFWPFAFATFASVVIAIATASIQARKAAVNNPVDALKYE